MFLRSQLVSRFPVSLLRLGCNSAPSTSNSTSSSTASFVVSRCNSHVIASFTPQLARHFGASLVWIRSVGKSKKDADEGAQTEQSDGSSDKNGGEDRAIEQLAKKIAFLTILTYGLVALTLIGQYAGPRMADNMIPSDAPRVDFATFIEKYLKAGEIRKIDVILGSEYIVATLHEGATIDGISADSRQIVIKYPYPARQFMPAVRREESAMGIPQGQRIFIHQELVPFFGISMLPPLFGAGCIFYLFHLILSKNGMPALSMILKKLEKTILKLTKKK